jgi:hypothetical protein
LRDSEGVTPSSLLTSPLKGAAPNPCGTTIVVRFVADRGDESQREIDDLLEAVQKRYVNPDKQDKS